MVTDKRSSNIELLRIIAMLMIVAHHFSVHGGFSWDTSVISVNELWVQFIQIGGKIGVDIFVLISGYYLILRESIKTSKVFKLWLQLLFYSIGIFVVSILLGLTVFSKKSLLDACFPVSTSCWWFASTYFVLFLFTPFINTLLQSMGKATYKKYLALMLFLWCALPTLSVLYPKFTIISPQFSNFIWFVTLYSLAAYIRLWHGKYKFSSKGHLLISISTLVMTFLSAVLFDYLNMIQESVHFNPTALYGMNSITVLIISLTAFLGFLQTNLPYSKVINAIATASFGVYLISDHTIIRSFLWITLFKNAEYASSDYLILYSIAAIFSVYLTCTIIELLRIHLIEKKYMKLIEKLSVKVDKKIELIFNDSKA